MTYVELKRRQRSETNNFTFMFAYDEDTYLAGLRDRFKLDPKEDNQITSIGAGCYVLVSDYDEIIKMFSRHRDELLTEIKNDTTGTGFICDMFKVELIKNDYLITGTADRTLTELGFTSRDLDVNDALVNGLNLALTWCNENYAI